MASKNQWLKDLRYGFPHRTGFNSFPDAQANPSYPPKPMMYGFNEAPAIHSSLFSVGFSSTNGAWASATYAPSTGYVYCLSYVSATLKIDPINRTTTVLAAQPTGTTGCWGSVMAPNGYIYGIPYSVSQTKLVKFNPLTETATAYITAPSLNQSYKRGVLAPNSCIYSVPFNATSILKINTTNDTFTQIGAFAGGVKWSGCVLAPNGKIYAIPDTVTAVNAILVINPADDSYYTFGNPAAHGGNTFTSSMWAGGNLGPDGKIYCAPFASSRVLVIDPDTDSLTSFPATLQNNQSGYSSSFTVQANGGAYNAGGTSPNGGGYGNGCGYGTLGTNGEIYHCVYGNSANTDLSMIGARELSPGYRTNMIIPNYTRNGFLGYTQANTNPYIASCLVPSGDILMSPYGGNSIVAVSGFPPATYDMINMPTNLQNLPTSAYNRHCNK